MLYTSHKYDTSDRLTEQNWQIGSDSFSESYEYNTNDGTLKKMTTGGDTLNYSYNNLKQLSKRTSPKLNMTYSYHTWTDVNDVDKDNNKTEVFQTNQVASVQYLKPRTTVTQLLPTLNYSYDAVGNITQIKEGGTSAAQYSYDDQNQVVQEKIPSIQTSDYTYDTYGNIRSKKTTYGNGSYEQYTYTYGNVNSAWKDQLTAISYRDKNGTTHNGTFSYDAVGNPLTYNNGKKSWTFTWQHGRQLAKAEVPNGSQEITYTYDVDGIRESKTVNGVKHSYTTLGGKIVREAYGSYTIDYFYDNDSRPYKMVVKNGTSTIATGYFVLNLQGDVIAIIDSDGAVAVKYQYDAWGREISNTINEAAEDGENLYKYNALKYRGYYYDSDFELYYLNSRFYDAEIGRFINADSQLNTQDNLGYNLYAYCNNNPVNQSDPQGNDPVSIGLLSMGLLLLGIAATIYVGYVVISEKNEEIRQSVKTLVENSTTKHEPETQSVYVMKNQSEIVSYVGRTNDLGRRQKEHEKDPRKQDLQPLEVKISGLSVDEARTVEQILISAYSISNLENARREIAVGNLGKAREYISSTIELFGNYIEDEIINFMRGR